MRLMGCSQTHTTWFFPFIFKWIAILITPKVGFLGVYYAERSHYRCVQVSVFLNDASLTWGHLPCLVIVFGAVGLRGLYLEYYDAG
jgi:hypothetical protein